MLYWNGEESHDEIVRRVLAICQHYGIDAARKLTNKLFIATGDEYPLTVASAGRNGIIGGDLSALCDALRDHDIAALVIDPFVACHLVPENDNGAINYVVKQFARIAACDAAPRFSHPVRRQSGLMPASLTIFPQSASSAFM